MRQKYYGRRGVRLLDIQSAKLLIYFGFHLGTLNT